MSGGEDGSQSPERTYREVGRYPSGTEGVQEMAVCFDASTSSFAAPCNSLARVKVVRCEGGFLLWRLPYAPTCNAAYCMVQCQWCGAYVVEPTLLG